MTKRAPYVTPRMRMRDRRRQGWGYPPPANENAGTPPRRTPDKKMWRSCTHWSGCQEPPVEGRPYCAEHAQRTDELASEYRARERRREERSDRGNA